LQNPGFSDAARSGLIFLLFLVPKLFEFGVLLLGVDAENVGQNGEFVVAGAELGKVQGFAKVAEFGVGGSDGADSPEERLRQRKSPAVRVGKGERKTGSGVGAG
jgi:hypothetical protein